MAKLTIIGASKGIGLETVKQALAEGHEVTAFARSASKIDLFSDNLIKRDGNALVQGDIDAAISGADVVIQTLGVPLNSRLLTGPITLFSEATRILIPALAAAGTKQFIAVTGYGAGDSKASIGPLQRIPFNIVFGRAYDDKSIQERLIRDSGLNWIIARPCVLTKGPKTGRYDAITDLAKMKNGLISRADVAHFLVSQIGRDTFSGKAPVLHGRLFQGQAGDGPADLKPTA
jgi:putative NADH-flavin reductase